MFAYERVTEDPNNNTNICKVHIVSIRAESEAPNSWTFPSRGNHVFLQWFDTVDLGSARSSQL